MPLVQQIADELKETSHRIRVACQAHGIGINEDDVISDNDWKKHNKDIFKHINNQHKSEEEGAR